MVVLSAGVNTHCDETLSRVERQYVCYSFSNSALRPLRTARAGDFICLYVICGLVGIC